MSSISANAKLIAGAALLVSTLLPVSGVLSETLPMFTSMPIAPAAAEAPDRADRDGAAGATATAAAASADPAPASAAVDAELECMAKVVHHEAGNQGRTGKLAVAQLMLNRVESGRFADTLCGVAAQPGQFFDVASYAPRHDANWDDSLAIAREARDGRAADVAPGALFFHAAYTATPRFFRSRTRVMTLGDHVFYR